MWSCRATAVSVFTPGKNEPLTLPLTLAFTSPPLPECVVGLVRRGECSARSLALH